MDADPQPEETRRIQLQSALVDTGIATLNHIIPQNSGRHFVFSGRFQRCALSCLLPERESENIKKFIAPSENRTHNTFTVTRDNRQL